jgi:dCTP deaminase
MKIWEKEKWLPGAFSKDQLENLVRNNFIRTETSDFQKAIDHSSIDLHLSSECYQMISGSIKPCGENYNEFLDNFQMAKRIEPDENNEFNLEREKTYVFKLIEHFGPIAKGSGIYGQATAKSSIGRMDVIARLIVDGMYEYEFMDPSKIASGNMYLEITSITFNVKVKEGISLSQLRLFLGHPEISRINVESLNNIVLLNGSHEDGTLSVDLSNENIGGINVAAFSAIGASEGKKDYIKLWGKKTLDPSDYWKAIESETIGSQQRIHIKQNEFYILRSKERISLPKGVCVYCKAMDETLGEMRIHYAGFVHPFFGLSRSDTRLGTPLIFEVRGHNVLINLSDGEKLAKLYFYRMSEDCEESKQNQEYNDQELKLSKFFKDWPPRLVRNDDNMVSPLK